MVVPSLTGRSALLVAERAGGRFRVVCVTFRTGGWFSTEPPRVDPSRPCARHWVDIPELARMREGWRRAGYRRVPFLPERGEVLEELRRMGVAVVVATDLGAGIDSSMAVHLGVKSPLVVMKETLYLFCPELKVAVFSAVTAATPAPCPWTGRWSRWEGSSRASTPPSWSSRPTPTRSSIPGMGSR